MIQQSADDGDSASSTPPEILVDPNSNTPYDAMLYCQEPLGNIDKFYHLRVSNYMFARCHFLLVCCTYFVDCIDDLVMATYSRLTGLNVIHEQKSKS